MNRDLVLVVALGALAAYFYTRKAGAEYSSPYPGYAPVDPVTGNPISYYPPGTLNDVYL